VKSEIEERGTDSRSVYFDWNAFMRFLLNSSGRRESIGAAWFLFFDIATHADQSGFYSSNYAVLAKKYGVAKITVKTWRHHLRRHAVIESYSRGHSVAFKLLEPYLSFVKVTQIDNRTVNEAEETKTLQTITKLILKTMTPETLALIK
jgi:hypothetical protein